MSKNTTESTEPKTDPVGTQYRNGTVNKGHKGNGNPQRPSVVKRLAKRAAEREQREADAKREAKNAKAREKRAAAKAQK